MLRTCHAATAQVVVSFGSVAVGQGGGIDACRFASLKVKEETLNARTYHFKLGASLRQIGSGVLIETNIAETAVEHIGISQ